MSRRETARSRPGTAELSRPYLLEVADELWPALQPDAGPPSTPRSTSQAVLAVPGRRAPRLLLPVDRAAATTAVRAYGGAAPARRDRIRSGALRGVIALGLAGVVFRHRMQVTGGITDRLADVLGEPVAVAVRGGPPRANRKPVLAVLDRRGRLLAFAKVGLTPLARELLVQEAAALSDLADDLDGVIRVPRLVHAETWRDMGLVVQEALPVPGARPVGDALLTRAVRSLIEATATPAVPWSLTGHATLVRQRLARIPDSSAKEALAALAAALSIDEENLPSSGWHGDWTSWNCSALRGSVLLWDWERFARGVPAGMDLLHHDLQSALARGTSAARTAAVVGTAPERLAPLGLDARQAARTAAAYLLELGTRYLVDDQSGAGARVGDLHWLLPALGPAADTLTRDRRGTR